MDPVEACWFVMPAYNHTKDGVVESTRDHVELNHEGDFHCCYESCNMRYVGRSSFAVQEHFEEDHEWDFDRDDPESVVYESAVDDSIDPRGVLVALILVITAFLLVWLL